MKEVIQKGPISVPPLVEDLRSAAKGIRTLKELCWLEQERGNLRVWVVFGGYNKEDLFTFFNTEWGLRRQAVNQGTPLGEIKVILSDLITPATMRKTIPQEAGRILLH